MAVAQGTGWGVERTTPSKQPGLTVGVTCGNAAVFRQKSGRRNASNTSAFGSTCRYCVVARSRARPGQEKSPPGVKKCGEPVTCARRPRRGQPTRGPGSTSDQSTPGLPATRAQRTDSLVRRRSTPPNSITSRKRQARLLAGGRVDLVGSIPPAHSAGIAVAGRRRAPTAERDGRQRAWARDAVAPRDGERRSGSGRPPGAGTAPAGPTSVTRLWFAGGIRPSVAADPSRVNGQVASGEDLHDRCAYGPPCHVAPFPPLTDVPAPTAECLRRRGVTTNMCRDLRSRRHFRRRDPRRRVVADPARAGAASAARPAGPGSPGFGAEARSRSPPPARALSAPGVYACAFAADGDPTALTDDRVPAAVFDDLGGPAALDRQAIGADGADRDRLPHLCRHPPWDHLRAWFGIGATGRSRAIERQASRGRRLRRDLPDRRGAGSRRSPAARASAAGQTTATPTTAAGAARPVGRRAVLRPVLRAGDRPGPLRRRRQTGDPGSVTRPPHVGVDVVVLSATYVDVDGDRSNAWLVGAATQRPCGGAGVGTATPTQTSRCRPGPRSVPRRFTSWSGVALRPTQGDPADRHRPCRSWSTPARRAGRSWTQSWPASLDGIGHHVEACPPSPLRERTSAVDTEVVSASPSTSPAGG